MTSNAIRGMRRKKTGLCEVKIAVIGAPGVGKSALTVRFLTKRYIGEYDHQTESKYKHEILVDGEPILCEILDTCPKRVRQITCSVSGVRHLENFDNRIFENAAALKVVITEILSDSMQAYNSRRMKTHEDLPTAETLHWADGFLLVYSITDRQSFNYVRRVKEVVETMDEPTVMVGNKADMVHLRQVSADEGDILAKDFECSWSEVAAAEQVAQIAEAFHDLCLKVVQQKKKNKQSLLDRMLGGKGGNMRTYSRGKSDSALPKD